MQMPTPSTEPEAALCPRCEELDFSDIFSGCWSETECRTPVAFFGKREATLKDGKCPLCLAFFSIAAEWYDEQIGTGTDRHCMYAIPSQLAYRSQRAPSNGEFGDCFLERTKAKGDSTWLVIRNQQVSMTAFWFTHVPESAHNFGCLAEYTDGFNGTGQRVRLIDPAKVDIKLVKRWLALCGGEHGKLCNPPMHNRSLPKGFVVINCVSRKLEPLPADAKFVALSYVWGASTSTGPAKSASMFPRTIEDSITVALELGIAYIWIDRYCVPQQDCPDKLEQIQKMHEIYREADLTIVAAAGQGPDHGLPGISTPRSKAPSVDVRIGSHRIVSTGKSAEEALRGTVWASRAWTYQEGLVSRRKLIFTDEQIYLHCMQREFRETIEQDFSLMAQSDSDDLAPPFQCGILHLIPQKHGLESVYSLIRDFSRRNITFQNDTLNALLGVLNFFQEAYPDDFRHIWGQPIPYSKTSSIGDIVASAMRWKMVRQTERRPDFPSWSWIGWKGSALPLSFDAYSEDIKASLLLKDGSTVEDAHVLADPESFQRLSDKLSKHLLVEADTVNVCIRQKTRDQGDYVNMWEPSFVKDSIEMGSITEAKGFVVTQDVNKGDGTYEALQGGRTWLGIVLHKADLVIVLKDMGGYYERFGYIDVRFSENGEKYRELFLGRKQIRLG
ncbi:heterokaryon incompatibility protein-domain-containing protein [Fusarium avenaceum]|nr:heterokaryon incompatibility protein-domain-containing protein [Fusarium avenaceum]